MLYAYIIYIICVSLVRCIDVRCKHAHIHWQCTIVQLPHLNVHMVNISYCSINVNSEADIHTNL